jgi:Conserved TM helix
MNLSPDSLFLIGHVPKPILAHGLWSTPVADAPSPLLATALESLPIDPSLWNVVVSIAGAIAILIIGWIVAAVVAAVVRGLLQRTKLDNRLAGVVGGPRAEANVNVEKWISGIIFWVIFIIAVVAFLDALNLTTVSEPLNNFLNQIFAFLPKLGSAAILIGVAWLLATLAKTVVIRIAQSFGIDERLNQATPPPAEPSLVDPTAPLSPAEVTPAPSQFLLSETLGNALYWFVFLFFLPLILGVLDLEGPLAPVQNLLNDFLAALPRIVEAIVIALVGWFIARIVRGIVTNLLVAAGANRLGARLGLRPTPGGLSLSALVGTVVYVLILIPTAIASLEALEIEAISAPATSMLNQILNALPQIFTAALILVVAYVIGQFVADIITDILTSIGFNNIFSWLGFPPATAQPIQPITPITPGQTVIQEPGQVPQLAPTRARTPSEVVGIIALVGIILFAIVAATNILNIPALTAIVSGLLLVFGQVLVGLVVFAVGLYLANLAFNLISSSGGRQARILGQTARIAVLALATAMALQQMGIASNIVNLAFGLLLGAIAVAIALAFGLGGRDVAAQQISEWLASFKQERP